MEGFLCLVALFVVVFLFTSLIKVVPQANEYVVEFLGSYQKTLGHGLHILIPFLNRVAKRVSLKEQVEDFPPQPVITKDNVTMQIDTVVYYMIFDSKLYTYGVESPIMALANLTATTLRNIIGELTLDECLTSRDVINIRMRTVIDEATDKWGIKVNRVELKNIIPPQDIQNAMEKQMRAEREKRQSIIEAEAHKQASVTRAQGDKEAMVLHAEAERDAAIARAKGQAESIRLVYEAEAKGIEMLKAAKMDEAVVMLKKLDALKAIGDGRATKIIIPTDLTSMAADMQLKGEMLGIGQSMDIDKSAKITPVKKEDDDCCDSPERSEVTKEFIM